MLRVLEPEVMDTRRDAEEYDAMDFMDANMKFAEDAIALVKDVGAPLVLDIGVGTGQIPELMLSRRGDMEMLAIDLAQEMLKIATIRLASAGLYDRCKLARMDAKKMRLPDAKYDLVICNSTIHHIPDPHLVWREIARVCKPTGAIIVRDLVRPPTMEDAWAIVNRVAAGGHIRQNQLFFDSLCAALEIKEVDAMVKDAGLRRMRVAKCSDRHWTAERPAQ